MNDIIKRMQSEIDAANLKLNELAAENARLRALLPERHADFGASAMAEAAAMAARGPFASASNHAPQPTDAAVAQGWDVEDLVSASAAAVAQVDEGDEPTERESLIACLEDDAAKLCDANPDDEMAQTMRDAAAMLAAAPTLSTSPDASVQGAGLTDAQIEAKARNYALFVRPNGEDAPGDYDVTKYECREDFFNCVRACAALAAPVPDQQSKPSEELARYNAVAVQNNGYEWGVEMWPDSAGEYVKFEDIAAASAVPAPPAGQSVPDALESCSAEEVAAFESFARDQKYDMTTHPLHWLFLNPTTYAARQGWKQGLQFARDVITATPAVQGAGTPKEGA